MSRAWAKSRATGIVDSAPLRDSLPSRPKKNIARDGIHKIMKFFFRVLARPSVALLGIIG
jgi:hypothetical protein